MNIKELVKDNTAKFSCYRCGVLYYDVIKNGKAICMFPIDITDSKEIGAATFSAEYKAITLMRYIRKAIDDKSLIKYT